MRTNEKQKPEAPYFQGTVRSALAKARRVLKASGLPLGKIEGRYATFGKSQRITPGWRVHRVGVSNHVSLYWLGATHDRKRPSAVPVIELLAAAGLPIATEDRVVRRVERSGTYFDQLPAGWFACEGKD